MNQLYAIRAYGGSYEDAWEKVEYVTDDMEKGTAYIARMEALRDVVTAANKQVSAFQSKWIADHPRPVLRALQTVEVPRWPSKTKPTPEMRAERKRLEQLNQADYADANKPMCDWATDSYHALNEFRKTFSEEIQEGATRHVHDTYWDIEPVSWLA